MKQMRGLYAQTFFTFRTKIVCTYVCLYVCILCFKRKRFCEFLKEAKAFLNLLFFEILLKINFLLLLKHRLSF
jgi:hypothetical protein